MLRHSRWLLAILLFSLLLNTWGIMWGLPERWHPDEMTQRAENMVGTPTLNPHFFGYGGFPHYLIAMFAVLPVKVPNKLLHLVDYDTQSTLVVTLSRLLSALMGTGVVFLTFLIGEGLFDRRTGLFAAALVATSMLLVNLAHFATVGVPSLFWFTLACLMAVRVFRGGARRYYVLGGLFTGLAVGVKYVGGLSLVALLAAHFLRRTRDNRLLTVVFLMAAVGFLVGDPVPFIAPFEFTKGFVGDMVFGSHRGLGLPRAFLPLIVQLKDAMGLPVYLLSFAGLAYGVHLLVSKAEERASVLLVLAMLLPYYVVAGSMRGPRAGPLLGPLPPLRYTLELIPFLSLLAAKMLSDLVGAGRGPLRVLSLAAFAGVLFYSALYAAVADLEFTHDSRYTARDWVLKNVKAGSTIETTSYGPNLPQDQYTLIGRPHDQLVTDVVAAVSQDDSYLRFQRRVATVEAWAERAGLPLGSTVYEPWYRRAVAHYVEDTSTFDISSQGLESRAPDVLVVSDLYSGRFIDHTKGEGLFFSDLSSGKTTYEKVAEFHYELPAWLNPPAEFVNPRIFVYSRKPSVS